MKLKYGLMTNDYVCSKYYIEYSTRYRSYNNNITEPHFPIDLFTVQMEGKKVLTDNNNGRGLKMEYEYRRRTEKEPFNIVRSVYWFD